MRRQYFRRLLVTGVGVALLGLAPAAASSANISHAYQSKVKIPNGSLVSLDPRRSDYVEPTNTDNASRLLGVAVDSNDSLIAVDSGSGAVQVATNGEATVLVSTLNGDIKVGEQIGVSPFNGIGMKALPGSRVIGLAQAGFNDRTPGAASERVKDKDGQTSTIRLGYTRVNIAIGTNGALGSGDLNSLQKFAQTITGHVVPTSRVVVSLAVALVALTALVTLLYASIYGSIVSIGRNPLAKYAVFRALGSVLGLAAMTSIVSGVTIFLLLR